MRRGMAIASALVCAVVCGCATVVKTKAAPSVAGLAITKVGVKPKTLDVHTQIATIRYELSHPAMVLIDLVDGEGRVVRQLDAGKQSAGLHTIMWDGRSTEGQVVPSGVYRYIIHMTHDTLHMTRSSTTYDPSAETGGEELEPWKFTFDKETGTLRWVMPKAGYARLRVGIEGFPHLRTLLDWEPLEAGEQTIVWDGLDESGLIRAIEHPDVSIKLHAFALPWNTLIVRNSRVSIDYGPSTMDYAAYPALNRPDAAYLHARHPRTICHETQLDIEFPEGISYDPQGRAVLRGVVPVRIRIADQHAAHVVNSRFEVAVFEDATFLFEEEDAVNPFTYLWDTTNLPSGEHLLTINILSYDDHFGVETQRVSIEQDS